VNSSRGNEDNREHTSKLMGLQILGACGCAISPVLNGSASLGGQINTNSEAKSSSQNRPKLQNASLKKNFTLHPS
jgi:hypothetical protein